MVRTRLRSIVVMTVYALAAIALLAIPAVPARADSSTYQIMTAQTATGVGAARQYPTSYKDWSCQFNITGTPSETVVKIEGNLTGSTYTRLVTWTQSTDTDYASGQGMINFSSKAAKKIRANLVTLTGGTNPTVTVICAGID